jgi:lipid-binding SYLF domain-containing protein
MSTIPFKSAFTALCLILSMVLASCSQTVLTTDFMKEDAEKIDARVDAALSELYLEYPNIKELSSKAAGILVMPLVTEAGLFYGGSYGRGALRVNGATEDYYSVASAGYGLQIGAHQYGHALFFLTRKSIEDFKASQGWALSGDIDFTSLHQAENIRAETTTALAPIVAVVFGQSGLKVGVSLEGSKYTRIIP